MYRQSQADEILTADFADYSDSRIDCIGKMIAQSE